MSNRAEGLKGDNNDREIFKLPDIIEEEVVGEAVDKARSATQEEYGECGLVFYGDGKQYLDN